MNSRPRLDLAAACVCGGVTLEVHGTALSMFLCSCLDCQRITGTGHSCALLVDAGSITVTGTTKGFERPSASGAIFMHHFCPRCGTQILGLSSRAPHIRMLPAGLFAGSSAWYMPGQLIFARSHQEWDHVPDDLPRHQTYRGGVSG